MILEETDRAGWLEQRRGYVTATDIAKLAHGGPARWAEVRAEKMGQGRPHFTTDYTEWGQEREPHIMAVLGFQYDVQPNARVHVLDGTRWAATPDGISAERTAEVKTSVTSLGATPDELRADVKKGRAYYDQVQWAMLAADRGECAFGWELNDNFMPAPGATFLIPRDEKRIAELIDVGERFLEFLTEEPAEPGEWDDLLAAYAAAKADEDEAKVRTAAIQDAIRERAGDADLSVWSPLGSISLAYPKARETFDSTAFKRANPDTYAEYVKTTPPSARTLRVTIKKG